MAEASRTALPRAPARPGFDMATIAALVALLALVPVIANAIGEPFIIRVATRVVVFAIAAVALNLVLGFGGLVSLLHAGLLGIGGYAVAIASWHEFNAEPLIFGPLALNGTGQLLVSLPLAALCGAGAAAVMGAVSLRTSGSYFIMITLAFNQMLFYYFVALQKYGGEDGLQITGSLALGAIDPSKRVPFFYICLTLLALTLIFMQRLINSRFGMVLRATAQNEQRVIAVGIPPFRYKLAAFAISGGLTALAGGLLATGQQFITPADMSWVRSGDFVVMCVLGGLSTVWGPVIGAAVFLVLELALSGYTTHWQLPFGLFIIGIAVFLRGGLSDVPALLGRAGKGQGK